MAQESNPLLPKKRTAIKPKVKKDEQIHETELMVSKQILVNQTEVTETGADTILMNNTYGTDETINETNDENKKSEPPPLSGCGSRLKAERELQGYTLDEVCKYLRLSISQIEAIENDDFSHLPNRSIVRGFIRNYCKFLKVDAEPIFVAFEGIAPHQTRIELNVKSLTNNSVINTNSTKNNSKVIYKYLLLALIILALAYTYSSYIKPNAHAIKQLDMKAASIQKNNAEALLLPLPNPLSTPPDLTASSHNQSLENTSNTNATTSVTSIQPTLASPLPNQTGDNTNSTLLAGESLLNFKLTDKSWIRIQAPSGEKIINELMQSGSDETISVKPPVQITIGNAIGVKLTVNNADYDLTPHTQGNIARIDLN